MTPLSGYHAWLDKKRAESLCRRPDRIWPPAYAVPVRSHVCTWCAFGEDSGQPAEQFVLELFDDGGAAEGDRP